MRSDVELMGDAFAAEFASFADSVRAGKEPCVTGVDARRALAIALASIDSYQARCPVPIQKTS